MIKFREARYCNLKLFLIFLVIYGHLIESQIDENTIIYIQYKVIYLFHMPAFAFLSGLFMKSSSSRVVQLKKTITLYVLLQMLCFICNRGVVDLFAPYWTLWYLLSLSWWLCATWCWWKCLRGKGRYVILLVSIVVGCMAGYIEVIGRQFSFSRTLVFFPYFWLGTIADPEKDWRKYRFPGVAFLCVSIVIFLVCNQQLTAEFLYQATPYGRISNGAVLRMLCYMMGAAVLLFLLAWIPDKRFLFTKAGADTMPAYLLHGLFAAWLRELQLSWYEYVMITGVFLWIQYRMLQIKGTIYGVAEACNRRNGRRCAPFKKYTKKMQENCMDSCFRSPETKY